MQEYIQQPKEQYGNTKTQCPTTGRPEHPNPEEAEENDLTYEFMKMIETLKDERKNSLKEMEENANNK